MRFSDLCGNGIPDRLERQSQGYKEGTVCKSEENQESRVTGVERARGTRASDEILQERILEQRWGKADP